MKKFKVVLTASLFMLAVGTAFASQRFFPTTGYTNLTIDPAPGQTVTCLAQKDCETDGPTQCQIVINGTAHNLYGLNGVNQCIVPLFERQN
ncbi:DUF6520 family protein [Chitinophaga sp. 30R24]|uniref:DUF6520 family protein n=1 Tax=Chitinophaga sp. 30R24 TaxID=3248838 RepID=UPI003B92008C